MTDLQKKLIDSMRRVDKIAVEIALAREKASRADTMGCYGIAAHFEDRAEKLERELKEVTEHSTT